MTENATKLAKELFVSNLSGGSIGEINVVALTAPATVLVWSILQSRLSLFTPYTLLAAEIDFVLNCVCILLATTLYSEQPSLLIIQLLLPAVVVLLTTKPPPKDARSKGGPAELAQSRGNSKEATHKQDDKKLTELPMKPFITAYRGTMMVITCTSILAVDFHVFPRRFAKVETWGTSLMDIGVGSFVFSAGVVAARPILKAQSSKTSIGLLRRLAASLRHSLPLLALGFIRLWSVKGLDYAEHVSEYGVHWNFFFTLALLPPFVALFESLFSLIPSYYALALLLGIAYQMALDSTDLTSFMLSAPRVDLLSQNREGLFSFFGYLSVYLCGQATGLYALARPPSKTPAWHKTTVGRLGIWSFVWTGVAFGLLDYRVGLGMRVSRRLANLPYIAWISAFNTFQLFLFCGIEYVFFPHLFGPPSRDGRTELERCKDASSKLLRALNRNGLFVFLIANLGTGLVNLTVPTLEVGDVQATAILTVYIAIIAGTALGLDAMNMSIKI